MTKRKVNFLIGLMVVALIGIIVLQLVWMRNALQVRNELFDRSVNEALIETSKRLETMNDVFWIRDLVRPGCPPFNRPMPPNASRHGRGINAKIDSVFFDFDSLEMMIPRGQDFHIEHQVSLNDSNSTEQRMTVQFFSADSVIDDWEKTIEHNITVMYSNSLDEIRQDSTWHINSRNLARQYGRRVQRLKNVAGKMVQESWYMNQDRQPDTAVVNDVLKRELRLRNIPIPFEMGVFCNNNSLIKTDNADSVKLLQTSYSTNLVKGEIFQTKEMLAVYFPSQKAFVLKSLILPASLSLIFCTFILIVFGISIYYILNQKKISEMKSDFINNMTHEFKTPLATISVATDTIINPKVLKNEEQIKHFADVIKKENQRMNKQVETILQIARLDKKEFEFDFKKHDIHDIIEKAVHAIRVQVESRGGIIAIELNAEDPIVTTDSTHILNMINNLLDNANKYSPDSPEIIVKSWNVNDGVCISVSDKGIGMSKQVQQRIFERFYRETTGNIHNVKGFGLGLSYAKAVIDANKGTINVLSEEGKGSTFEVFLPFVLG